MHPLLTYSVRYEVSRPPSAWTVLNRITHFPVSADTLAEPATDPPTAAPVQLVFRSPKFPWTIVVEASSPSKKAKRSNSRPSVGTVITNLDVLYTIHTTLLARVTPDEWEALGSKAQRKVTRACRKRCSVAGGQKSGVRRVDWLCGKTHLIGIEVDRSGGNGVLIFAQIPLPVDQSKSGFHYVTPQSESQPGQSQPAANLPTSA
jgi:hypothetical protein